jgi:sensor histidine kinase YesM
VSIDFYTKGDFTNLHIAPLIIFPFIENAFKYGINASTARSWVKINIQAEGSTVNVQIDNSYHPRREKGNNDIGGIGVANALKRLELLYKDNHTVEIRQTDEIYSVGLTIILK